jgi:aerobic-type carbon monoxide dehydrogenase small subunit (CoxS/CutS family)
MSATITVNGVEHPANVDPAMPLLWFLRETLNQTGTKYGCGMGLCGTCTVHIDGEAVRSCLTPVSAATGRSVTTIEGLHETHQHPLQLAWVEHRVPQCGYCQSGQIMNAASFLRRNPNPSEAEVDQAMQGNICRCGTYKRVRAAILSAAGKMSEQAS